jgi:putative transposase
LALSQSQPLGNARFMDTIERMTGQRREVKPRGRPRAQKSESRGLDGQTQITLQ